MFVRVFVYIFVCIDFLSFMFIVLIKIYTDKNKFSIAER